MLFAALAKATLAKAVFAGGCFWCMVAPFEQLPGVEAVTSGYTGGSVAHPSYEQVSSGTTGHLEAVEIRYDPTRTSYATLLDTYWANIDPLDDAGQFCDSGSQYRPAIFVANAAQAKQAQASRTRIAATLGQTPTPRILRAARFWPAESYHQDFHKKSLLRYRAYRAACGRDARLRELWGNAPGSE